MKYVIVRLSDARTGEIIYETKNVLIGNIRSLRSKIDRNIDSTVRYLESRNIDVDLEFIIREQRESGLIFPINNKDIF